MGSVLSASLGFDAITRDDLIELGFRPHRPKVYAGPQRPTCYITGEPNSFIKDLVVWQNPGSPIGNMIVGRFQLVVTFPKMLSPDGGPVAVLTRKLLMREIYAQLGNNKYSKSCEVEVTDDKNEIVNLNCDLQTLKTMMDENYLRSLI